MAASKSHYEIIKGDDNQFYWHLVAGNGEIAAQSEGYTTKASARRAVIRFKEMAKNAMLKVDGE